MVLPLSGHHLESHMLPHRALPSQSQHSITSEKTPLRSSGHGACPDGTDPVLLGNNIAISEHTSLEGAL